MNNINNKQKKSPSLERDYLVFSGIIILFLIIFGFVTGSKIYLSQKYSREMRLSIKAQVIEDRFTNSLNNVGNFIQFIGDKVLRVEKNDPLAKSHLFEYSYSVDPNFSNLYSWTVLNWVNKEGKIVIGSRGGNIDKISLSSYPLENSKKNPWQLHIGDAFAASKTDDIVIPVSMGIEDDKGNYQGAIISNIITEKIKREINKVLDNNLETDYIILDRNYNIILQSSYLPISKIGDEDIEYIKSLHSNDSRVVNSEHNLEYNNSFYTTYKKSDYPFIILVGYNKNIIKEQLKEELLPYIYLASMITFVFLIVLYIFRRIIILPIIDKLRQTLAEETAVRIEKERMLSHILSNIPGFVYRHKVQKDGIIAEYVSEGCFDLTGYEQNQYFGKDRVSPSDIIDKDHLPLVLKTIESSFENNKPFEISYPIITSSGKIKWVLNQGAPVKKKGKASKFVEGLITDITEIKEAEKKMQKMLKDLAISNTELERFAHICSHDLKEPLRTIFSYIQLFKGENTDSNLSANSLQYLDFIENGALRMRNLIENILLYSQIGAEDIKREKVDLNEVLKDCLKLLHRCVDEKRAEISSDRLISIDGNYDQLLRLFQNIISNSLKFTNEKNPKITITKEQKDGMWIIYIKDNGIGVAKEYQKSIFNLFEKLHTQDEYQGTGIGLSLCKKIVEQHGGKIWVDSELGKGMTVIFSIPAQQADL